MKMKDLLAFSPAYQAGRAVHKGKIPGALFGLAGLGIEQHGKRKRKKKKKRQTEVGQTQKFNRGGMVNKSKIMHGYKKGGQV
tara:strand:+ start:163 stop:408 length:246 start_codon:yes stop_codon:yes gene_type:complete